MKLALPSPDKPAVRAEAEAAVRKIAAATEQKHPEAVQAALERAAWK